MFCEYLPESCAKFMMIMKVKEYFYLKLKKKHFENGFSISSWQIQIGLLRKPTHNRVKKAIQTYSQTNFAEWFSVDLLCT